MSKCQIIIVFPEYEDSGNICTASYLSTTDMPEDEEIEKWLKELYLFADFYKDEECELLYDSKNAFASSYIFKIVEDCYPSRHYIFQQILKNAEFSDWRKERISDKNQTYNIEYSTVQDESRTELFERKQLDKNSTFLLVVHMPNYHAKEWLVHKNTHEEQIKSLKLCIPPVYEWLCDNRRPTREYNWNPKHGENGKGAHPSNKEDSVSLLLGSKEEAAELMRKAIGNKDHDWLYIYDSKYKCFMEFKAEQKACSFASFPIVRNYHSYHIDNSESNKIEKKILIKLKIIGGSEP